MITSSISMKSARNLNLNSTNCFFRTILILLAIESLIKEGVKCSEEFKIDAEPEISCREKTRLIGTDKNDLYELVTAPLNGTVELECHFW